MFKSILMAIGVIVLFPVSIKLFAILFWGELFRQLGENFENISVEEVAIEDKDDAV